MNIFFDFDGVILDSLDIKEIGFSKIFNKYNNEDIEKILCFHRENLGKSRFIKIKYFYNNILNKDISSDEVNDYANNFSEIMRAELNDKSRLISDSIEYIKNNYKNKKLFIVSGTEEIELKWLCAKLNITSYFVDIKGSPTSKEKNVKDIIDKYFLLRENSVMIGDSVNDYDAAKFNKIKFFGYNNQKLNNEKYNYILTMNDLDSDYKNIDC